MTDASSAADAPCARPATDRRKFTSLEDALAPGPWQPLERLIEQLDARANTGPCSMRSYSRPATSWGFP